MHFFYLILFVFTLVNGLPLTSSTAGNLDISNPFVSKPIDARPVISRSVDPRVVESSFLETRQSTVPGAYIIEFKEGYVSSLRIHPIYSGSLTYVLQSHDALYAYLKEKNVTYEIRYVYNYPNIFMGVSIQLNDGTDYAKVVGWEGIGTMTPVHVVIIPPLAGSEALPVDN
jgi:hypothetical protein